MSGTSGNGSPAISDLTGGGGESGRGVGGYSGGAGRSGALGGFAGGGGGSFDAGTDQILGPGIWTGNGKVVINLVPPVFAGTPGKRVAMAEAYRRWTGNLAVFNGAAASS